VECEIREPPHIAVPLGDAARGEPALRPLDFNRHLIADAARVDHSELPSVLHPLAVERNHVAG
jgi:hypothetical protein